MNIDFKPEILETDKKFKIINVSLSHILSWGGLGLCDSCAKPLRSGTFIGALNSVYCEKCFDDWHQQATYYPEDLQYEQMATERILNSITSK